jgi:hypothetical protein
MKNFPLIRACALSILVALLAPTFAAGALTLTPQDGAATGEIVLPDGTELTVVTTEEISSKTATEGDPVNFKVDEDVKVNGRVVIAKGSLVKGEISNAKKSGRMGKGGQLSLRVLSTESVDGQKVKLRASKGKEGDDKTGTTVALVVLFGPLGFLKKGKDAKIKEGTRIKAYTDEEKKVVAKL